MFVHRLASFHRHPAIGQLDLAGKTYSKEELQMVLDAREEYRNKHKN